MLQILNWFDNSDHVFGLIVLLIVVSGCVRYASGKDIF